MRLKSAYRGKPAETPNIPEEPPQPSKTVRVEFTNGADKTEPAVAVVSADDQTLDEATIALKKQLADLRESERLQREFATQVAAQRMAQQQAQPPTREQLVQAWRANGGDPDDIAYLQAHPEMIDRHDLTVVAAEEAAQQGFERGTDAHREATREIFDRYLGHQQAQPAASAQPTPAFFQPPEPSRSPAAPDRAALYAAAPSRREAGTREPQHPRQVRLSPEEQEWARISGLSDIEYARHRLRLDFEKKTGQRQ